MTQYVDPVTTEIIRNAFMAAAEDMRATLWRSAFSPVIYEMKDCSVALFDDQARLLAQAPGLPFFLGALSEVIQVVIDHVGIENFRQGDVYIVNDPYLTGSHLNDVDILSPVVFEDELVGFTVTRAHWLDMGSKDAAYAVDSTEIFQEGLRLGPIKIIDRGELVKDVIDIIARNSRLPYSLKGDMHAQIASCRIGERRYGEIIERLGLDTVRSAMQSIFDTTDKLEREAIVAIPDGVYQAQGYQDNDFQSEEHIPVKVKITVQGSEITVDTHGSSWQRRGCTNCGLIQTLSAIRLAYKFLVRPDLGVTGGSFRSLSINVELGSIFAAQEPTACLQYGSHTMLLVDLIVKALAPALPNRVTAGLPGDAWNVIIIGPHPKEPGLFMCLESTAGGWGASAHDDGDSGVIHFAAGDFKNLPVETLENKYPVRVHHYAVGTDTGGAGRFRGGLNIVREYEMLAQNSDLSLWFERTVTPQWGLFGGRAGAIPKVIMEPGSDQEHVLLKVNHNPIASGTRFRAFTGGGGGYGPPWERDVRRVQADVIDGYVSRAAAADEYGVYFEDNCYEVDEVRTQEARAQLAREKQQ
jgi:N-methylhydantoinase B